MVEKIPTWHNMMWVQLVQLLSKVFFPLKKKKTCKIFCCQIRVMDPKPSIQILEFMIKGIIKKHMP